MLSTAKSICKTMVEISDLKMDRFEIETIKIAIDNAVTRGELIGIMIFCMKFL